MQDTLAFIFFIRIAHLALNYSGREIIILASRLHAHFLRLLMEIQSGFYAGRRIFMDYELF